MNVCANGSAGTQQLIYKYRLFVFCFHITAEENDILRKILGFISHNTVRHNITSKNIILQNR